MRSIKFSLADLAAGETAAEIVQCYQSATSDGVFVLVDSAAIVDLVVSGDYYLWSPAAESTYYLKLATITAENPEPRYASQILGPLAIAEPTSTIEIDSAALNMIPKAGTVFRIVAATLPTVAGTFVVEANTTTVTTGDDGRASVVVPQGVSVKVIADDLRIPIIVDVGERTFVRLAEEI